MVSAPPAPFIDLGSVPMTAPPATRWHVSAQGWPDAAITDLGTVRIWTYSEDQAAALEAAFAQATRLHRERGQS